MISTFFSDFLTGFSSYNRAWNLAMRERMWKYTLIPMCISTLSAVAAFWFALRSADFFLDLFMTYITPWQGPQWWHVAAGLLVKWTLFLLNMLVFLKIHKLLVLTLLSPFLAYLTEKVQLLLGAPDVPFSMSRLLRDAWRSTRIGIYTLLREISMLVLCLMGSFILPFLAPLFTALLFLTAWYFYGFSLLDFRNEYHQLSYAESRHFVWKRKGLAVGLGFGYYLLLLVPVLGLMTGPVLGTIAANLATDERADV